MNIVMSRIGAALARFLSSPRPAQSVGVPTSRERLELTLAPGDVLLVEGTSNIASAIKYLTQSTWSHLAIYVGRQPPGRLNSDAHCFVEADLLEGVRSVGLDEYDGFPTRICRPVGLSPDEIEALIHWVVGQLGHRYDLRNVFDLARFLLPTPPIPARFRRRLIAMGSGDPTRAICSTLAAQAFGTIGYPILPDVYRPPSSTRDQSEGLAEVHRIRHHSLYAPRDFDVSPYFEVVKPTLAQGFDFRLMRAAPDRATAPQETAN